MGEEVSKAEDAARRKRVNRYKKIVIITIILLIVIPTILCIFLFFKTNNLQNTLDKLLRQKSANQVSVQPEPESQEVVTPESTEPETQPMKKVYLTFDDGPSQNTEAIINVLNQYNAKATFFVIGKTGEESAQRYKAIVDSGNAIGMHSYSHIYKKIYSSVDSFAQDFTQLRQLLYEVTGQEVNIMRFPGGSSTTVTKEIPIDDFIRYTKQAGYIYYDWNVSSGDASGSHQGVQQIVDNIVNNVDNFEVPIVLMHDSSEKVTTLEALPVVIEELIKKGYQPCALDESVVPVQHVKAENIN